MEQTVAEAGEEVRGMSEEELNEFGVETVEPAEEVAGASREEIEEIGVEPGDQGSATVSEAVSGGYEPPAVEELTADELDLADEAWSRLRGSAQGMDVGLVISELVKCVDVHSELRTPMTWPGDEDEEFRVATVVERIGAVLCRGCPNIEIHHSDVMYLWRHRKSWTKKGKTVLSEAKSHGKYPRFLSKGVKAAVRVNYTEFRRMNPLQKVFTVYRGLRRLDADGKTIPFHFSGFKDELEVFGGRVFREQVVLRTAAEAAKEREAALGDYQLSLLEGASE